MLNTAFEPWLSFTPEEAAAVSQVILASVNSILTAGKNPVFADVEPDSENFSAANIQAIICVYLAGWMGDRDLIYSSL